MAMELSNDRRWPEQQDRQLVNFHLLFNAGLGDCLPAIYFSRFCTNCVAHKEDPENEQGTLATCKFLDACVLKNSQGLALGQRHPRILLRMSEM